ncbi:2-oxoadipate dehydrogenase complex component E1 [Diorhabda sublineata]|uniref:2-oxoadipate dehydrogenase complex component E1 n=1 Tax=Diorhabda sublineata TaxID=1163346 RepID=UPI0024E09DFE|nr:2-oxoadipate dehydrogenase complex component E1 [Diorhabda sublineata]
MYGNIYKLCCNTKVKFVSSSRINFQRQYHSDNVFGFNRKTEKRFQVSKEIQNIRCKESNFYRLVSAYRQHGHKYSQVNPVALQKPCGTFPELEINRYGFRDDDLVQFKGIINSPQHEGTVKEAVTFLNNVYCNTIAAEYVYLENEEEIEWLNGQLEQLPQTNLDATEKISIACKLLKSQNFDYFMAKKFASVKRYGGEGAESLMVFFAELLKLSARDSMEQIVLAMNHRGRLNLLTGLLNHPPVELFSKLKGNPHFPSHYKATGDVISHSISSTDIIYDNNSVHVTMVYNPSHLEAQNSVSMGKTRAKQMMSKDGDYGNLRWSQKVLNVQVHGDAAISAQGINQECLGLSHTPHFEIGGGIHLIVNNQVGFTTPAERGRSSRYCTDIAKIISAPVIHVNGDHPEDVLKVTRLAFQYQRKFRKEIFIDLNCYRQRGHNELDDPSLTNPALYSIIRNKQTVPDSYARMLLENNIVTEEELKDVLEKHETWLNEELKAADNYKPMDTFFKKNWEGMTQPKEVIATWDTGIDTDLMTLVGNKSVEFPETFSIHPTLLKTHVKNRKNKITEGINIDWASAETLALGSLLFEGYNVRISGQDVGRGTFSHRHVMLVDQNHNNIHIPLNNIHPNQKGFLEVANSILSEEAVLGFEYGMSIEDPRNLIIWEAQFGDFFNGAQIIFDTFIGSSEAKWLWQSGLTVLLPHGYDGAGPEHSSCRLERFLQMTDSNENKVDGDNINMQVCQASTPAQYFHLLRRQMVRNYRKPLIIATPKILLRHPACVSDFVDMIPGTFFKTVIGDTTVDPSKVRKILITSGKHYYSLLEKRGSLGIKDTAIITIESLCPFPALELREEITKYPKARVMVWSQEEPQNMGAWSFVKPRFENLIGMKLIYTGRDVLPTPAVGIGKLHQEQAESVINRPFLI